MKDRNYLCIYYEYHGKCKKNKNANILSYCQHCGLYSPNLNLKPFRNNNKKKENKKRGEYYE